MTGKETLLSIAVVIGGGIASVKSLMLIRALRGRGVRVIPILSKDAHRFITPLSVSALSGGVVYDDLFSVGEGGGAMAHVTLPRSVDKVVVAPLTASLMARMASGSADDMASAFLLACEPSKILIAPAMNPRMWANSAVQRNQHFLLEQGMRCIGPEDGTAACGDEGIGRMTEPDAIVERLLEDVPIDKPLFHGGRRLKALVTSGPTHEPLDGVRYLTNRSSGKQGHAIAQALQQACMETTLISGPVTCVDPQGVEVVHVDTAHAMFDACLEHGAVDVAVCAAAVSDWHIPRDKRVLGKWPSDTETRRVTLQATLDILKSIAQGEKGFTRPRLVIGFAAMSGEGGRSVLVEQAQQKRQRKGCDWMMMNDVGRDPHIFGGDNNRVTFMTDKACEEWPLMSKHDVAVKLTKKIIDHFM
ncbi:MAG: bifunctional phosphopantothenoylcysteine decarboxylase/phosphopantothenate--cysteine ligase CoaBC [Alphaproteobacteria bacterium GM7ARS4]|nr:bifunctional phosphopantothenoylcysteine decarboxylase/phosphopantothenate--cysteine ligase CoaBC [Alphaproteobacteria bacterium GM7ARS4]